MPPAFKAAAKAVDTPTKNHKEDSLLRCAIKPTGVLGENSVSEHDEEYHRRQLQDAHLHQQQQGGSSSCCMIFSGVKVFLPWTYSYKLWWSMTAIGALLTAMFGPYAIAYHQVFLLEELLTAIFLIDILVNFNLAFYRNEILVYERSKIVQAYFCSRMFWIDLLGVLPLDDVALWIMLQHVNSSNDDDDQYDDTRQQQVQQAQLLSSLFRLVRLVRLHRLKPLSDVIQYNPRISLMWFTLIRNFAVFWFSTHFSACTMYFLARLHGFGDDTWLGPLMRENEENGITMSGYDRYMVALYWSVVTFVTVGYGDFVAVNAVEQTWASVFMFASIVVNSWIIGSITLLVVKGDEKTGEYRDSLQVLNQYSTLHEFDDSFTQKLRKQLRLEFYNREIADEQVLKHFPSAMRRKVLRKLYWQPLMKTSLLRGVRPQFVDAFLSACSVEIFSPGEEIVQRGSISSDLFLLVGGIAEITTPSYDDDSSSSVTATIVEEDGTFTRTDTPNTIDEEPLLSSSNDKESKDQHQQPQPQQLLEAGCFVGEIGFFTESPQIDSVSCLTVCKTLTMSQSSYQLMAQTHPGSVGKILQNLLRKVEEDMQQQQQQHQERRQRHAAQLLPKALTVLRTGSMYDPETDYGSFQDPIKRQESIMALQQEECMTTIHDLVKMHLEKQKDDQTTRLLFAASRNDLMTIRLMCDQGFDANNADYDNRTALMVASMKGNTEVVKLLLVDYKANPNLTDVHGSSALYEAVKNGHESIIDLLLDKEAKLCMEESLAASILCQAVHDGDILFLRRLLRAKIPVNAADYDMRTAAHIAAAEGNVVAIQVLREFGADLTLQDRWNNTVDHEAQRAKAGQMIKYLNTLKR